MNSENIRKNTFRIGAFRVEPTRNLLKKGDQTFALEPRIMDVLCELASFPTEVIPRYELIKRIWKVDYGADESLTRAISVLRKTFRKGGETEKYIETISKNGYRLIAHVGPWDNPIQRVVTAVPDGVVQSAPVAPLISPPAHVAATPLVTAPVSAPMTTAATAPATKKLTIAAMIVGGIALALASIIGFKTLSAPESRIAEIPTPPSTANISETASVTTNPLKPITVDTGLVFGSSVAVLSFSDLSLAGDQEYFADGMAVELLNQLYTIPNLRVVSRQASFALKGQRIDPREIGRKLQVSHIIAGSVRTNGELVRISTQLINATDASQLWSKSYTGKLADGFSIQEQVARDSMNELAFILSEAWTDEIPENLNAVPDHTTFKIDPAIESPNSGDSWGPNGPPQ